MEKVVVFVDVQNIYYTTKQAHNCHFDYNAFWAKATSNREVVKAIAYAVDRDDEKQKQFQNILRVRKNITSRIVSFGKGVNADRWCSSRLGRHRVAEYAIDPFPGQPL